MIIATFKRSVVDEKIIFRDLRGHASKFCMLPYSKCSYFYPYLKIALYTCLFLRGY